MANTDTVWTFKTRNFVVALELSECDIDPADSFEFPEDIEAVRSGAVAWFDAAVIVRDRRTGAELGWDSLGGCAYEPASDFWTAHRGPDPMDRNCSIMRAAHPAGPNVSICHYFPGMVSEAVASARKTLADLKARPLRVA